MDTNRDAGEVKREICHRLVSDWQELADHFDIPPHERVRFDKGREPHGVWEWLEAHDRFAELSAGLAAVNRQDLVRVLPVCGASTSRTLQALLPGMCGALV